VNTIFFSENCSNSFRAAKDVAKQLELPNVVSTVSYTNNGMDRPLVGAVGFAFPVCGSGLPKVMIDFITKVELSEASYIYLILSHDKDRRIGLCFDQAIEILGKKNKGLSAAFCLPKADAHDLWSADTHTDDMLLLESFDRIRNVNYIAHLVSARKEYIDMSFHNTHSIKTFVAPPVALQGSRRYAGVA